jgi:hypothetical protein
VCGASATLATSIVLPDYKGKEMDVAFVVVAINALATLAMVVYPLICTALGFDAQVTGVMLAQPSTTSRRWSELATRCPRPQAIRPSSSSYSASF